MNDTVFHQRPCIKIAIRAAVTEFLPLYDELTTSDFQGICEARARYILNTYDEISGILSGMDEAKISRITDEILTYIYGRVLLRTRKIN